MNKNTKLKKILLKILLETLSITILILFGLLLADMESPKQNTYSSKNAPSEQTEY